MNCGRVVIPIEIRNQFGIVENDEIEFFVETNLIRLKKYESNCIFCKSNIDLIEYKNRLICKNCIKKF